MDFLSISLSFLAFASSSRAQETNPPGVITPLATNCLPASNVLCINKYDAVLPYHFYRYVPVGGTPIPYGDTIVGVPPENNQTAVPASNHSTANNPFATGAVSDADFLVFDEQAGLEILGANPTYDFMFHVSDAVHEAPVYVPGLNLLYMSILSPPPGTLPQLIVNLNNDPPTIEDFEPDPPIYAPNGGTYHNGLVYWAASGGNESIGGGEQRVGIRMMDPYTNKTTVLLNNYYGYYFTTIDDLIVDAKGDIWFTDPYYAWFNKLTDEAPQLPSATWRFRPSTGAASIVEDTLFLPNGITQSPDGQHIYISDTGASSGDFARVPPQDNLGGTTWNQTTAHTVYKYDVIDNGMGITNKRPIYLAQDWIPDGLKCAANGYVLTGAGFGIDVLDQYGTLLVRIQTNYTVQNFVWTGPDLTELWMMGNGGVSRVKWNLAGPLL
ncbi:calcium-dependent phosphotriesterase [Rhizodiscina lignyota]|uniref:Calcium-dependent phosphotriesterase n=1 Tax=Rhizodiscina lignyota TaxID=1504668 RepID=A0A9P4IMZ5_9PEZI|nr:calcium-dependent phosphotriesterase [Rhizodiscina lignyota]